MTDLSIVLPAFPTQAYTRLIPSLEKGLVNTTDLLTLDAVDIAKRAQLPLPDVKRLCKDVLQALQTSLSIGEAASGFKSGDGKSDLRQNGNEMTSRWNTISTLDDALDTALKGGIATGYITEITGESGAGKTQFLISLLLAAQLPAPHGLSQSALYISTESALPTSRLSQMLKSHPTLMSAYPQPSLDRVISIVTPDLESQDHILRYQLPVAIRRHNVGLVVLDSVAANYRAEFERPGITQNGANMAKRSAELVKLGQLLRDLARTENIAIVVANQVADRFTSPNTLRPLTNNPIFPRTQSSPLAHRSGATSALIPTSPIPTDRVAAPHPLTNPHPSPPRIPTPQPTSTTEAMTLDHQQRWFTGWGDDPRVGNLKTPSLGLVWTSQIACRIALIKRPVYGVGLVSGEDGERGEPVLRKWRRWAKVVFAAWAPPSGVGLKGAVEFEITRQGIKAVGERDEGEGREL